MERRGWGRMKGMPRKGDVEEGMSMKREVEKGDVEKGGKLTRKEAG